MGGIFGGGETKQQTNQTTRRTPYRPATAGLNTAIGQATNVINQPGMFTPTYSPQTMGALEQTEAFANQPTATSQYFQPVVAGGTQDYMTGAQGLRQTAAGPVDPNENPYYAAMRDRTARDIAERVNAAASGAGRYGSGMHTGALTRGVGEALTGMDYNAFEAARARQDAAQRALYGSGATLAGRAGQLTDAELGRLGVLSGVGQQYDIMDEARRMAPARAAEWGLGALSPVASQFGTNRTRGTTTTSQSTPIGNQILGGGMMLGSMLSSPFGGGLMGGLGALGGGGGMAGLLRGFQQGYNNPMYWGRR